MQLHSPFSATARPFQPGATSSLALVDNTPRDYPARDGLMRSSPAQGRTRGLPVRETTLNHHYTSDEDGVSTDTSISDKPLHRRHGSRGSQSNQSGSDSDETHTSGGR